MDKLAANSYSTVKNALKPKESGAKKAADIKSVEPESKKISKKSETEKIAAKPETKVELSDKAKDLKKSLTAAQKAMKISEKEFGSMKKPGIYFVSGFDWFSAGSIKGNYDGIPDMADAIDGADHYTWDQKEDIIEDIKKRRPDQPIVLVGHSFGGDSVFEVAQELNTLENGFRKIDLMVTLDSVGLDNDMVPQNVKKNVNFIAKGPYEFINDGPNIALNYQRTKVENYLRPEKHAELDDTTDIQITILEEIQKALS